MTEQLSQAFIRRGLPKYNKARGFIKDEAAQFYFTIMKKFYLTINSQMTNKKAYLQNQKGLLTN